MTKVAVLCGGDSDEREVSLRSGAAVANALRNAGYEVEILDPAMPDENYETLLMAADVVFPALHGKHGEDGVVQKWLEARGIQFVGADSESSAISFDKWQTKQVLIVAGLPTPEAEIVTARSFSTSLLRRAPFVLKPFDGGSSVDTLIVRDISTFDESAALDIFERHESLLLEQLIDGIEITVPIMLEEVLPVIEIVPPQNAEFDYENKYNGMTQELCPPVHVSEKLQKSAQDLARKTHAALKVRDLSRTDIIIDSDDNLWILEINTIPGMTEQSLLPKAAAVAGYPMDVLCDRLVKSALSRAG